MLEKSHIVKNRCQSLIRKRIRFLKNFNFQKKKKNLKAISGLKSGAKQVPTKKPIIHKFTTFKPKQQKKTVFCRRLRWTKRFFIFISLHPQIFKAVLQLFQVSPLIFLFINGVGVNCCSLTDSEGLETRLRPDLCAIKYNILFLRGISHVFVLVNYS